MLDGRKGGRRDKEAVVRKERPCTAAYTPRERLERKKRSGNGVDGAQMVERVGQTRAQTVGLTYDRGVLDGSSEALASLASMRECKYN